MPSSRFWLKAVAVGPPWKRVTASVRAVRVGPVAVRAPPMRVAAEEGDSEPDIFRKINRLDEVMGG
jgi:hypothetical protein